MVRLRPMPWKTLGESDSRVIINEVDWISNYLALQDGPRLQALEASHMYDELVKWYTKRVTLIQRQETLNDLKNKVEETTGLRPTFEKLLEGR